MTRPTALFAAALTLTAAPGCSDDNGSTTVNAGPTGTPRFGILDPADGSCISIGTDPDATIPIHTSVREIYLRPPGTCGDYKQCGHLVLTVNGIENNEGSAPVIDVLLRKPADPYADLTITFEVINDEGQPIATEPIVSGDTTTPLYPVAISVVTKVSCGGGGGGAGGAGGGVSGNGGAGGGVSGNGGAGGG